MSRADADPRNVLHEDDPSILVAGSSLISRSSSLWKGQLVIFGFFTLGWRVSVFRPPNGSNNLELYLWHDIVVFMGSSSVIIACCILAFLWSKERLKADPDYLSKPSANE